MKTIFGEYFACGHAFTSDSQGITLEGIAIDKFQEWIDVQTKYQVLGTYPKGIQDSEQNAGKTFQLDVCKVVANGKETYFGCYEWRMCWYLFYKFSNEDIVKIKNN